MGEFPRALDVALGSHDDHPLVRLFHDPYAYDQQSDAVAVNILHFADIQDEFWRTLLNCLFTNRSASATRISSIVSDI
jgi:hypothetical protein